MEEAELIRRSQQGDIESFNGLVERYQGLVYNLALRMLGRREAAEDATQQTFLSAYRGVSHFRAGSFRAWLLRIAANACYDALRRLRRHPTVSLEELTLAPETSFDVADPGESPEAYTLRQEQGRCLRDGIALLPADQRMVVILVDVQGLSYEEVAQALGTSVGTVKSRLSRARSRLRHYLLQQRELFPGLSRS